MNFQAKLKAHIHDPNAPELVHFLFTPLALIVDASHDTHYKPNIPSRVVSPLLTRDAINLLMNCVTSKETELWHSLGDAWLIPRYYYSYCFLIIISMICYIHNVVTQVILLQYDLIFSLFKNIQYFLLFLTGSNGKAMWPHIIQFLWMVGLLNIQFQFPMTI